MKRYKEILKKFWETFLYLFLQFKIISIEMKRYLENFYSLFMHDG